MFVQYVWYILCLSGLPMTHGVHLQSSHTVISKVQHLEFLGFSPGKYPPSSEGTKKPLKSDKDTDIYCVSLCSAVSFMSDTPFTMFTVTVFFVYGNY